MLKRVSTAMGALLLAGCSVVGIRSGTEQPSYQIVDQIGDDVEIRRYDPRLAAEVTVAGGDGTEARDRAFRILADYIFGENQAASDIAMTAPVGIEQRSQEIAMTAPVATRQTGEGGLTMRFFLPASFDRETVPRPTDDRITIVEVPAETLAALRFTGARDADAVEDRQARLLQALAGSGWQPTAAPAAFLYDPPWTVAFLRRNEAVVEVAETPGN